MLHTTSVHCPSCKGNDLVKNGKTATGIQRWQCNTCKKSFQLTHRYNACSPGVKEQIITLKLNSSGVRDIGRILKISKDTVTNVLKKTLKANTKN